MDSFISALVINRADMKLPMPSRTVMEQTTYYYMHKAYILSQYDVVFTQVAFACVNPKNKSVMIEMESYVPYISF